MSRYPWDLRVDYDEAWGPRHPPTRHFIHGIWDDPTWISVSVDEQWMAEQNAKLDKQARRIRERERGHKPIATNYWRRLAREGWNLEP